MGEGIRGKWIRGNGVIHSGTMCLDSVVVGFKQAAITLLTVISITSCSTYSGKFECGDAKGLGCTMLREVDNQIDSGQIEEIYSSQKCKGKKCTMNHKLSATERNSATLYSREGINKEIKY